MAKAELLQEGIFFLLQLFARDVLVMKKLEIEKTKPTFIISTFKTDIIKVGLVFSISNFFIAKTSLANNWRSFSSSYLALEIKLCVLGSRIWDQNHLLCATAFDCLLCVCECIVYPDPKLVIFKTKMASFIYLMIQADSA